MKFETDMTFKSLPPNFQMKLIKQHPEKATEMSRTICPYCNREDTVSWDCNDRHFYCKKCGKRL